MHLIAFIIPRFWIQTAVYRTYAHNFFRSPFSLSKHLAISITILFFLTETQFYSGVFINVSWCSMPSSWQNLLKPVEVYFVPLLLLMVLSEHLLWFFTRFFNLRRIEKTCELWLFFHKVHPSHSCKIINKKDKILNLIHWKCLHWSTHIYVYMFSFSSCSPNSIFRKWRLVHLLKLACST